MLNKIIYLPGLAGVITPERLQYLRVVVLLVRRDLKVKYRGSFFGYLWSMLNPLLFMLIISFVFSKFMKGIPNYNLYVLSGILCWNMANHTLVGGTHSIAGNGHLMRKIKLPIWVFPCVPLGTALVNLGLSFFPFFMVMLWSGQFPTFNLLALPSIILLFAVFLLGISLTLSTLNVFFRDVGHVLEPVLQLTFYATPIIYDRHRQGVSEEFYHLLGLNPFTQFVEAVRFCLLGNLQDTAYTLTKLFILATLSLLVGTFCFKRAKTRIIFNL